MKDSPPIFSTATEIIAQSGQPMPSGPNFAYITPIGQAGWVSSAIKSIAAYIAITLSVHQPPQLPSTHDITILAPKEISSQEEGNSV